MPLGRYPRDLAVSLTGNPRALPCVATVPNALEQLWQLVAVEEAGWVLDPFAGTMAVKTYFQRHDVKVVANDINPAHGAELQLNACQPKFWRAMRDQGVGAVVCSPWYDCLDLVLPLAVKYTRYVVCMHVSYSYYANMPKARALMFRRWLEQGRVAIVTNLPRVGRQRQCAWVCVFGSASLRERLVRAPSRPGWLFIADAEWEALVG